MNAEAILTPGGIADQLTRGLSGLGQSFARREELLYQGQRDRVADDRYTAEMALRQQAQARQDARQALEDRRYEKETMDARKALAYKAGTDMREQEYRRQMDAQKRAEAQRNYELDFAKQGAIPPGQSEYVPESPLMAGARGALGWTGLLPEQQRTPYGQVAQNAREALGRKGGASQQDMLERIDRKAEADRELKAAPAAASAGNSAKDLRENLKLKMKLLDAIQSEVWGAEEGSPEEADAKRRLAQVRAEVSTLNEALNAAGNSAAGALGGGAPTAAPAPTTGALGGLEAHLNAVIDEHSIRRNSRN